MSASKVWRQFLVGVAACAIGAGVGWAKLPQAPMDDAAKAKAEEAKVKAADATKKAREQEEKAMDRVAERYKKGKVVKASVATDPKKK